MRNNLRVLGGLQAIDLKIDGLKTDMKALEEGISALEAEVADVQAAIAARNAELEALEGDKTALDENIVTETDNINRSEARLKEIKTQKEYQAVSKEITTAKKLKAELEEQVVQKAGQSDEIRGDIASREGNLQALEQNVAARKTELQGQIDELNGAVSAETAAREEAVKTLPASVVKRYTILREQRRGIAVVEARDGCCSGCNMNLPPQLYNTLYRGDELITCPHCQRILLLRQEQQ